MKINYLTSYLKDFMIFDKDLHIEKIDPFMTNGLLVKGSESIKKIGFAVSASIALFEKAKRENCDTIIVHHSFNFPPTNRYDYIFQKRYEYLIKNQINLFGYHFLLDAHPKVGNNVQIIKQIEADPKEKYLLKGEPWGYVGEYKSEVDFQNILKSLENYLSKRTVYYADRDKKVKKVVAVSGKGAPLPSDMQWLLDNSIDLYITGEAHEWNRELFKEAGIGFIAFGHYASEIFGIKELMRVIQDKFKNIDCTWLDLLNEI